MRMIIGLAMLAIAATPAFAQDPIKLVASFSILGNLVHEVCGDACEVTSIVGPDADAHLYEPTMADAIQVAEADLIFVNGMGFETWSEDLIANSGTRAEVIMVNVNATAIKVEGAIDPHAWNDPENTRQMMAVILKSLVDSGKFDAAQQREMAQNAAAFDQALSTLVQTYKARVDALPANRRTVVTVHDAFGYLGAAFGLEFLAPVGIDGEAEPSAGALAALIAQINSVGAAALFVENIQNPDLIAQIASETGLSVGGRLYSDALSVRGGPATSYLAMFEYNMEAILAELELGLSLEQTQ